MNVQVVPGPAKTCEGPKTDRSPAFKEVENPNGRYQALTRKHLDTITDFGNVTADDLFAMRVVSAVLPFRTNRYVIEHLIDWERIPDDPVYQLVFPQRGMLGEDDYRRVADLLVRDAPNREIDRAAAEIRAGLNPHPAGQREFNIPSDEDEVFEGLQHKYRETVLFFPSQGQTCHAYCTFCFRWAQFVGDKELKISSKDAEGLHRYLAVHPDVSDLLVTGGDPMIMKTRVMEGHLRPFIDDPALEHVRNIRIGTKALTFWPHRFVHDEDADDMLRLLEDVVRSGRHVAIMAHFNHWQELQTGVVREAVRRIRDTGAVIRSQAPLLAHINNDPDVWARMWREQVGLGIVPYYMFVERDTGAKQYFEVPLGALLGGFPECRAAGVRARPHRARPEHERDARQGRGARRSGSRRREGFRAALPAGPRSRLGRPALLRQIRSAGDLARRAGAGLRRGVLLLRGRAAVDDRLALAVPEVIDCRALQFGKGSLDTARSLSRAASRGAYSG